MREMRTQDSVKNYMSYKIQVRAAIIIVTNTNDSGPGSLRQALVDANRVSNSDRLPDRNQVLRHSPSPTPTGFAKIFSEVLPGLHAHLKCGERILESRIEPGHRKFITL